MTTTDTLAALQQAARQVTEDHALRLAIADKLEEEGTRYVPCPECGDSSEPGWMYRQGKHGRHYYPCEVCTDIEDGETRGTGTIPDTLSTNRAEAIRLGVEAERIRGGGCAVVLRMECDGTKEWCIRCRHIARLSKLIDQHKWLSCPCPECGGLGNKSHGPIDAWELRAAFDRGFINVELETEECWEECPSCFGYGGNEPDAMNTWNCKTCNKTGIVPAPLLAELARSPQWPWMVIRVRGKRPELSTIHSGWFRWYTDDTPKPIYELLNGEYPEDRHGKSTQPYWQSAQLAIDALGAALWTWANLRPEDRSDR